LQRLPSNVYWQGLSKWCILTFSGSQDAYHRSLDLFYEQQTARQFSRHEHEGESADEADLHNWHVGLPQFQDDFPIDATLALSSMEAKTTKGTQKSLSLAESVRLMTAKREGAKASQGARNH